MLFERVISPALASFLGAVGVFSESTDPNSYFYLKYRIFPTPVVRGKCQFSLNSKAYTDIFYDKSENGNLTPNNFYRERRYKNESKFVEQTTHDIFSCCHAYTEKSWVLQDGFEPLLKLSFNRHVSENEKYRDDVYLDSMDLPSINMKYEVVSIRVRVEDSDDVINKLLELFEIAFQLPLQQFDRQFCNSFLENKEYAIFPMYSKFMYALQMSINFEFYNDYCQRDPINVPLQNRLRVASNPANLDGNCYIKEWVWLVDYQLHYFQTRLRNCADKTNNLIKVLESVESDRFDIFQDESIQLLDEVDPICC